MQAQPQHADRKILQEPRSTQICQNPTINESDQASKQLTVTNAMDLAKEKGRVEYQIGKH